MYKEIFECAVNFIDGAWVATDEDGKELCWRDTLAEIKQWASACDYSIVNIEEVN